MHTTRRWLKKPKKRTLNENHNFDTTIRWPLGCLFVLIPAMLLAACASQETLQPLISTHEDSMRAQQKIAHAYAWIAKNKSIIKNGDIITRTGNDFTSQSLRSLNQRDKTYSHCGIASVEHDSVFVYHALGGEWNPNEKLRRDALEIFAEPYSNNGIAVFRFTSIAKNPAPLLRTVRQYYAAGLPFDMEFDLATEDRMYCAEFVCKALQCASNDSLQFSRSKIKDFEFVGVDDIFLHKQCSKLAEIVYK